MNIPILADFHTHTVASGHAYSTILEYIEQAKKIGLKYFAMTDHGPAMPGGPHKYHFDNIVMVPGELDGVRIIRGVEANIVDSNGNLDLLTESLEEMEFILFTFHPHCGYENQEVEGNTKAMIKVMERQRVSAIAHLENQQFPIDYETIVHEAHKRNILIEVNNSSRITRSDSREASRRILRAVKKLNAKICLGTDSHISLMLGKFDYALELIAEAGIPEENIINTSEKMIKQYILNPHPTS